MRSSVPREEFMKRLINQLLKFLKRYLAPEINGVLFLCMAEL